MLYKYYITTKIKIQGEFPKMCYICNSYHGHEIGCPFSKVSADTFVCSECGKVTANEDRYGDHDMCCKCAEREIYGGGDDE